MIGVLGILACGVSECGSGCGSVGVGVGVSMIDSSDVEEEDEREGEKLYPMRFTRCRVFVCGDLYKLYIYIYVTVHDDSQRLTTHTYDVIRQIVRTELDLIITIIACVKHVI